MTLIVKIIVSITALHTGYDTHHSQLETSKYIALLLHSAKFRLLIIKTTDSIDYVILCCMIS